MARYLMYLRKSRMDTDYEEVSVEETLSRHRQILEKFCKDKKLNVVEAMEQAIRDSQRMQDGVPALFHRRNRKPWLVTMRLVDWLELFEANKTLTKHGQPPGK